MPVTRRPQRRKPRLCECGNEVPRMKRRIMSSYICDRCERLDRARYLSAATRNRQDRECSTPAHIYQCSLL
jgi:hypothetical protein